MLLRSEDFFKIISVPQHHLHPNSRILSEGQILKFRPVARQNPPVLQPLEMECSGRQHPLSSVSGRRRYNTLDFPTENRVPTGRFRPYWKPGSQGTCSPFTIPARLCICIYKLTKSFLHTYPQTKKSPEFSSKKERNSPGIFRCRIHGATKDSCVTRRCGLLYFRMDSMSLRKSFRAQTTGTGYRGLASFLAQVIIWSMSLS